MALAGKVSSCRLPGSACGPSPVRAGLPLRARHILVRADPRVTREYREEDDTISVPGEAPAPTKNADGSMYVTDAPARRPQKKDNLSKEMKARLRQEYVGLGGAENSLSSFARRPLIAAATITAQRPSATTAVASASPAAASSSSSSFSERPEGATIAPEASTSASHATTMGAGAAVAAAAGKSAPASKFVVDENENLKSTPEHRAWTWVTISMLAAQLAQAWQQVHGGSDVITFGAMVFVAYVTSDFATGVYHWGVDNWGDGNTPVFGRQIAAFQGHHQRPWTITQREFCNNVHQVFAPAAYPAALLLATSPLMPMAWNAWSSSFLFLVCMSQQFHAWSHMKKSELHPAVVTLQDAGLLIGRRMHGAHHKSPFDANYCIVSGWCNPLLDKSGFFQALEKLIHERTGVEPRSWSEPDHDWRELERPGVPAGATSD